jgi:hypothetical protein
MSKPLPLSKLLEARSALLDLKLYLTAVRIQKMLQKYRPDQPRVPSGQPEGGQWVDESDAGRIRVAGGWDLGREGLCNAQLDLDEELCRMAKNKTCWGLTQVRWAACMKNEYVPTLRF